MGGNISNNLPDLANAKTQKTISYFTPPPQQKNNTPRGEGKVLQNAHHGCC